MHGPGPGPGGGEIVENHAQCVHVFCAVPTEARRDAAALPQATTQVEAILDQVRDAAQGGETICCGRAHEERVVVQVQLTTALDGEPVGHQQPGPVSRNAQLADYRQCAQVLRCI